MPHSFTSSNGPMYETNLSDQVRDRALLPLVAVFADMLGTLETPLTEHARQSIALQREFLNAARDLRVRRDEIVSGFRGQLTQAWDALSQGRPQTIEDVLAAPATEALSLVSDQELDSRLSVRDLAAAIRRECKEQVSLLDRRVGRLLDCSSLETGQNPVGPEHVSAAVYASFSGCDFELPVLSQLLLMCEGRLASSLSRVYASLNEWMAQVGVKPAAPSAPNRGGAGSSQAAASSAQGATPPAAPEPEGADELAGAPLWATRFLSRMAASGMSGMPNMMQGMAPGMMPSMLAGAMPMGAMGAATAPAYPGLFGQVLDSSADKGDMPAVQAVLLEALHYMLQQSRSVRTTTPDMFAAVADAPQREMSQREIISVLSLMQATPGVAVTVATNDSNEPLTQRVKREMYSGATQLGVDPASVRLSPADEDVIDLVGLLFDVMLDERDLNGRARELLGRLVVPFVKVAMIDRRMFVQKTHPARRLLNALAEACEGNDGARPAGRNLLAKVEEVVERLLAEFNESVAIFKVLEEEFCAYLDQYRRGIEVAERRAAEAQRGQERLEAARTRMQVELQQRLADEALPQAIKDFLYQPWAHHVTLAALRDGGESGDGQALSEALAIADGLLAELEQARAHVAHTQWLETQQAGLMSVFASVGLTDQAAERAVDALRATLKSIAETRPELERSLPEFPQVEVVKAPEPSAASAVLELVGGTDTLDFDQSDASVFRELEVGTWLDFIDKDNKVQSCKLSWISPISSRLLFVNRRGLHYCVASPEELAAMVRLGRLRPHQNQDAFDSAMQGVIERLEPSAA